MNDLDDDLSLMSRSYYAPVALQSLERVLPLEITLIPISPIQKRPLLKGWTTSKRSDLTQNEFRNHFVDQVGIGVLTGDASDGICMIDIDLDETAIELESQWQLLQKSIKIIGARGAKWLVKLPLGTRGSKLYQGDLIIGELLATGQQGVIAGIHPTTNKPYQIEHLNRDILEFQGEDLNKLQSLKRTYIQKRKPLFCRP